IVLDPDCPEFHNNLGAALFENGQPDEAIDSYRQAIALKADLAEAHNGLGQALLLQEQFREGWEEYEWRWKLKAVASTRRNFSEPEWNGSAIAGSTILLHAE